ncbi:hypothetical protein A3C68_01210 [Candidatus Kuenenbacteria bacterium RIFCSPHIGHO2_02_FULL_42_29]|nr:MAG: hypothetical protein A3C68_01210 [Candidatus Kuenenbacteria bacterium RIFCSPHIGHO2_02_FULL_42_29]
MNKNFATNRRSIRLPGFDYSEYGYYFVTICTYNREPLFGEIINGKIKLNDAGRIVFDEWNNTANIRKNVELDIFTVMPNHFHAIIKINRPVGAYGHTPISTNANEDRAYINTPLQSPKNNLGAIIRGFKSATTTKINLLLNSPGVPVWQRNYYEHIVREEDELNNIRQYILENPHSWVRDENNPKNF